MSLPNPRFGYNFQIKIPKLWRAALVISSGTFIVLNPLATHLTDMAKHVSHPTACKFTSEISITRKQWRSVAMQSVRLSPMTQQALLITIIDLNDSIVQGYSTVSAE
jgi:hypothetical protein